MEIVEKHHNQKLDAPSGTALALADSMNDALGHVYEYKYDRSSERKREIRTRSESRQCAEAASSGSMRSSSRDSTRSLSSKHTAYSRSVFGKGLWRQQKFLRRERGRILRYAGCDPGDDGADRLTRQADGKQIQMDRIGTGAWKRFLFPILLQGRKRTKSGQQCADMLLFERYLRF